MQGHALLLAAITLACLLARPLPAGAAAAAQPALTTYTVRAGDTLWRIARRHGTRPERLAALNGIKVDATLAIGQRLRVPAAVAPVPVPAAGRTSGADRAQRDASPAVQTYRVQPGDTLWGISRRFQTRPERLAAANGISIESTLSVGQVLKVPAAPAAGDPVRTPVAASGGARARLAALPSRGEQWFSGLVALAMRQVGVRYRWGGATPSGFDCSGFLYYVFGRMGIELPRTTYAMFDAGVPVAREELQPGDLVFFETVAPGPSHAGIYLGDGRFIHASSGFGRVTITPMDYPYYAPRYLGARRF
ncbi:MAG: LysM peptidoglycan-binding domain-containing protein [Armatimonadota bacterium]|nr:LysM peptidoglycan-binding domain-containing protein [Armatimonadota bacterium]